MKPVLLALAAGALGAFAFGRSRARSTDAPRSGPQPLRAGVPYLFIVRLNSASDPMGDVAIQSLLESKGASLIVFSPAILPPFWAAPGADFIARVVSFKATPQGNSTITLGQSLYDIGRLESLSRLDGQPFASPGPFDAPNEDADGPASI